jgi:hypothetical protein
VSAEATGYVWRHSPYRGAVFAVHLAIADVVNDQNHNELWMGQRNLAAKARTDRKTANLALQTLVADGMVTLLEEHRGKPCKFRFEFSQAAVVFDSRVRRDTSPLGSDASPTCGVTPHELKKNSSKQDRAAPKKKRHFSPGTGWIEEAS